MAQKTDQIRNIGLIGHSGCGKTSLAEAILYDSKVINRLGKVDDGSSTMDFEPEEIKRKVTLGTSFCPFNWKNKSFNLIDTPGENDFLSDAKICLQAAEGAILIVDAVDGVKVGTEKVWGFSSEYNLSRIVFINKIGRERADFYKVVEEIENTFSIKATPIYLPVGTENEFKGLVNLIRLKAHIYKDDGSGSFEDEDIPASMKEMVDKWHERIMENIVEANDDIMEKYLEGQEITPKEIEDTLIEGVKSGIIVPVIPGSAALNIGISQLLDSINQFMPFPSEKGKATGHKIASEENVEFDVTNEAPFSALVFKTFADPFAGRLNMFKVMSGKINSETTVLNSTKNVKEKLGQLLLIEGKKQRQVNEAVAGDIAAVAKLKETTTGDTFCKNDNPIVFSPAEPFSPTISFAVEATEKENEDKVFSSLLRLAEEDPTLKLDRDQSTAEIILSGTGQIHIENTRDKLKRKFGVEISLKTPKIPYRETIKSKKEKIVYRHKKQSGGRGQFAEVHFDIFPLKKGEGFVFEEALTGMNVPRNFVPAVEKGIVESMKTGVLAGYPAVDIKIRFFDGKSHEVDSSEMAFKIASSMCFKKAFQEATPILLEPIMNMEIKIPDDVMGDVIGDINGRRGKVLGMDSEGKYQIIKAEAPMAEVLRYSFDLTSMTGGRGSFQMKQSHYEEVPAHLTEKVIAASKEEEK
ncbi:MAG: elongation factor G [Thermodesulfobacteriota bacterium]|nr:elongation factor G [Thermodesulfobacteriota bacterium]